MKETRDNRTLEPLAPSRSVTRRIDLEAPASVVWDAITEPDLAAQWLGDDAERTVTDADEQERLTFTWNRADGPTRVDLVLEEDGDGTTTLTVTETALTASAARSTGPDWSARLESLRLCLASLAYA
jgi:uncharacterized protein YndB with AHSA1/START domain